MSMTKKFYRRLFLNKPGYHSGAYVIADVKRTTHREKDGKKRIFKEIDASLIISDCSRVTTLDFSVWGTEKNYDRDLRNVLYKAHTVLHVVQDFVAALEEAIEENETDIPK